MPTLPPRVPSHSHPLPVEGEEKGEGVHLGRREQETGNSISSTPDVISYFLVICFLFPAFMGETFFSYFLSL